MLCVCPWPSDQEFFPTTTGLSSPRAVLLFKSVIGKMETATPSTSQSMQHQKCGVGMRRGAARRRGGEEESESEILH